MNGEIAQVVALVSYGNSYLRGASVAAPELLGKNSTFQYVRGLRFVRHTRHLGVLPAERDVGTTTADWFSDLRDRRVIRLEVCRVRRRDLNLPPHASVAFVGGETCGLLARSTDGAEEWIGQWGADKRPSNRIWFVTYHGKTAEEATLPPDEGPPTLRELALALDTQLAEAERFAVDADLPAYRVIFSDARGRLVQSAPPIEYHPDMVPPDFDPLAARQLLGAATRAWVFGGMGSWNDVWFDNEALGPRYTALTPALFEAVMAAIIGGANASGH